MEMKKDWKNGEHNETQFSMDELIAERYNIIFNPKISIFPLILIDTQKNDARQI